MRWRETAINKASEVEVEVEVKAPIEKAGASVVVPAGHAVAVQGMDQQDLVTMVLAAVHQCHINHEAEVYHQTGWTFSCVMYSTFSGRQNLASSTFQAAELVASTYPV